MAPLVHTAVVRQIEPIGGHRDELPEAGRAATAACARVEARFERRHPDELVRRTDAVEGCLEFRA